MMSFEVSTSFPYIDFCHCQTVYRIPISVFMYLNIIRVLVDFIYFVYNKTATYNDKSNNIGVITFSFLFFFYHPILVSTKTYIYHIDCNISCIDQTRIFLSSQDQPLHTMLRYFCTPHHLTQNQFNLNDRFYD